MQAAEQGEHSIRSWTFRLFGEVDPKFCSCETGNLGIVDAPNDVMEVFLGVLHNLECCKFLLALCRILVFAGPNEDCALARVQCLAEGDREGSGRGQNVLIEESLLAEAVQNVVQRQHPETVH